MRGFGRDERGSAVQWFALAAAGLCVASVAGAHALDWLSQPGRISLVAYRASAPTVPSAAAAHVAAESGIDVTPTGSVPAQTAVVIRLR